MGNDTLVNVGNNIFQTDGINIWFIISIIEFILIIALLFFRKNHKSTDKKSRIKKEVKKEGEIDFNNTLNSAFNSQKLYNELKIKCHPDRFVGDDDKIAVANTIFQEITRNKLNFQKLEELKKEAEQKLGI